MSDTAKAPGRVVNNHAATRDSIALLADMLPKGVSLTIGIRPGSVSLHDGYHEYVATVHDAGGMVMAYLSNAPMNEWRVQEWVIELTHD